MKKKRRNRRKRSERPPPTKAPSSLNKLARELAKVMNSLKRSKKNVNHKVFCTACQRSYCLGYDFVDVYCETCYYKGCIKESKGRRTCQKCGGNPEAQTEVYR